MAYYKLYVAIDYLERNKFNGSQLAKMKKSIPDMSLPWNL